MHFLCFLWRTGNKATTEKHEVTTTRVDVWNNTDTGRVKFHEKIDWSGMVQGYYPDNILTNHRGNFLHQGVPPAAKNGSMAGVIYVGPNVQGQPDKCAWVFAWSVPGDGYPNKVYVESGPISKYPPGAVNWDKIRNKLKDSVSNSHYFDEDTAAEISAKIECEGDNPALEVVLNVSG